MPISIRPAVLLSAALLLTALSAFAIPPAIQINQPTSLDAEELSIAVDPTDPSRVVAGANLRYFFRSIDSGATWAESKMTSTLGAVGDPCVTFDADGNLFYSHLSYPTGGYWLDRIVVQKSTDGGLTWNDGVGVGHNPPKDQDKSWLTADRTDSPHRNNLYLAWTEFDSYGSTWSADSTRILLARSTDGGTSFDTPVRISDRGGNCADGDYTVEGAVPAVGPDGEVYLAWAGHHEIYFDRSLDGGMTFGDDVVVTTQPGGWNFPVSGVYRANGFPVTACDVSGSPFGGRVYVCFSDQRNGANDTDIFLCSSDDRGATWTPPLRVNDDSGAAHQFFPWMSVDPVTGLVAIVFYDRRDTHGDGTDVFLALSGDGGATFRNLRISDASFTPWFDVFFGDYIGIDAYDGAVHTAWMAMDQGDLSVWTAKLTPSISASDPWQRQTSLVMKAPAVQTTKRTEIEFTTYQDDRVKLNIYDIRGRLIRSLVSESRPAGQYKEMWNGTDQTGSYVSSGMYIVRLESGRDFVTRKIVVVN